MKASLILNLNFICYFYKKIPVYCFSRQNTRFSNFSSLFYCMHQFHEFSLTLAVKESSMKCSKLVIFESLSGLKNGKWKLVRHHLQFENCICGRVASDLESFQTGWVELAGCYQSYTSQFTIKLVEKILKCSMDSIPSPSLSVKIEIIGGKVLLEV